MATMNVSLPDELKAWVEEQTKGGGYATASDVVRDLVRRAIRREEAIARLNALIQEGIDSGPGEPFDMDEFLGRMREKHRLTHDG